MNKPKKGPPGKVIAGNKRARYEYEILDEFEAGLVLLGSEVKSLRDNGATISEAYARFVGGELFLQNAHIPVFNQASIFNHEPRRSRKLLLRKRELRKIKTQLDRKGLTLVPLTLYFNHRNRAKIKVALGRGKKLYDKRQTLKKKEARRAIERVRD